MMLQRTILNTPQFMWEILLQRYAIDIVLLFLVFFSKISFSTPCKSTATSPISKHAKWQVTQVDLHRLFHTLGAGQIEEVRIQREKGFGFVRYGKHTESAAAIQAGNGRILGGKPIKVFF